MSKQIGTTLISNCLTPTGAQQAVGRCFASF